MRLRPDWKIAEHREDPTTTERTLAALVSTSATRVYVEKDADDGEINGMYLPKSDQIILFKCKGNIPAVAVALEEAGHSLMRQEYLDNEKYAEEVGNKLAMWHPTARYLIDWYEDARVYARLKDDYPGAAPDLDLVWQIRRDSLADTSFDLNGVGRATADQMKLAHAVLNEFMKSIDDYEQGRVFKSFHEVLQYLDRLVQNKPKTYPNSTGGPKYILIVGKPGDYSGPLPDPLKTGSWSSLLSEKGLATITIMYGGAGNQSIGFDYPWRVLSAESISMEIEP